MTTHANEELWRAFGEEVGEQLDNLVLELTRGAAHCDIHQVFRDFHTIKSSCAMLDLGSMKELAHFSEDYLDRVRQRKTLFTEAALDVLLSVVETLKRQLAYALLQRKNPQAAADVMAAVRQLLAAGGESPDHLPVQASPKAAADIAANQPDSTEWLELANACRDTLASLSQATQLDADLKHRLMKFSNLAELFEFPLLANLCRDIVLAYRDSDETFPSPALLHHQVGLMETLRCLQENRGVDLGVSRAEHYFRITGQKNFTRLILELAEQFSGLERLPMAEWLVAQQGVAEHTLERLSRLAGLFGLSELAGLLGYIGQVLRSTRRGYCPPGPALAAALRQAIDHPYAVLLQEGEAGWSDTLRQARLQLTQALHLTESTPQTSPVTATCYEVVIDMSHESATVEALVECLAQHGHLINNTSRFDQQQRAHICFLVEMEGEIHRDEAALRALLQKIDPEEIYFRLRSVADSAELSSVAISAPDLSLVELSQVTGSTLRISSYAVDALVTQVGEVVMARNLIGNLVNREKFDILLRKARYLLEREQQDNLTAAERSELGQCVQALISLREEWLSADTRLQSAIQQVQYQVLDLRKMPVVTIFNRLPNIVRKAGQLSGKSVRLDMAGQDATIDKGMMDILLKTLAAVLHHLVVGSSAITRLELAARVQGNRLCIRLAADGPMRSTAAFAPVKTWLEAIGGQLLLENNVGENNVGENNIGENTNIVVRVDFPRSVAMQTVLLVQSGNTLSAIPERHIIEIRRHVSSSVHSLQGRAALSWRGEVVPLASLHEWINGGAHQAASWQSQGGNLVIVNSGSHHVALHVNQIIGLRDSFVPETHAALSAIPHVNGTTVLGDGSVAFVLNVEHMMQSLYGHLHGLFHRNYRKEKVA